MPIDQFDELLKFMKLYESKFEGCFARATIGSDGSIKIDMINSDTGKAVDDEVTWLESDGTNLIVDYISGDVEPLSKLIAEMEAGK